MFTGRVWNPAPAHLPLPTVTWDEEPPRARLEILEDHTRSALSKVNAPDLDFGWSVNPYRGCTHACAYCYAREYHEYLELGVGSDFERRISVKLHVADLLREAFDRRSWAGELVAFSGATDCYQPLERRYALTRACLEVCAAYRNPVSVTTRSPLVTRDLDLLGRLAEHDAARVTVSIPILDPKVARRLEPGAPSPAARLEAIRALADAGIPVGVSLMPVIPGLTDHAVAPTLQAAHDAGARWSWLGLLRLPGGVGEVFASRLAQALPDRADAVMARLRRMRGGAIDGTGPHRSEGTDPSWHVVRSVYDLWTKRLGLGPMPPAPRPSPFRRPGQGRQLALL